MDAAGEGQLERVKAITTQEKKERIPEVTLGREFRIIGQIGGAGQRERLSYTSLLNQIESGQRKQIF